MTTRPLTGPGLSFSWWETLLWIFRRRQRFSIVGYSMQPTLNPGQQVLMDPNPPLIQEDDIVVCQTPNTERLMVKRVVMIEDGQYFVQGDNRDQSTDSRQFGWLKRADIIGQVVSVLI